MNYKQNNLKREYLKQSVMTASPTELIVMLYDSCIKNLKLAELYYTEKKAILDAGEHLLRAQKIIMELVNSLDVGVELSTSLLGIYDYLLYEIRMINVKKDFSRLPDVLAILTSMRDTWEQLARPNSAGRQAVNG